VSRSQEVDLTFLIFSSHFYFLFNLFSSILFFRTRVRVRVVRSCCYTVGYLKRHGQKSHNRGKNVEHSGRDDVIQYVKTHVDLRVYTWSFRVG